MFSRSFDELKTARYTETHIIQGVFRSRNDLAVPALNKFLICVSQDACAYEFKSRIFSTQVLAGACHEFRTQKRDHAQLPSRLAVAQIARSICATVQSFVRTDGSCVCKHQFTGVN